MEFADDDEDAVVRLGRSQLDCSRSQPVPEDYLAELRMHISFFPDDTNFHVTTQPGRGFGLILCREKGCESSKIKLASRPSARDGGKAIGFGSLSNYRVHVVNSPTHEKARDARLEEERADARQAKWPIKRSVSKVVKKEPSQLTWFGNEQRLASPVSSPAVPSRPNAPSSFLSVVPKKRTPDVAFAIDELSPTQQPLRTPISVKKARVEAPKTPRSPLKRTLDVVRQSFDPNFVATQIQRSEWQSIKREQNDPFTDIRPRPRLSAPAIPGLWSGRLDATRAEASGSGIKMEHMPAPQLPSLPFPDLKSSPEAKLDRKGMYMELSPQPSFPELSSDDTTSQSNTPFEPSSSAEPMDWRPAPLFPADSRFDEDGDFYGRGKDHFAGPIASVGDIDQFLQNAGNAEQFDGNASIDKALAKLGLPSLFTPMKGLAIQLMPHQAIGVAWMLGKELGHERGGIMADEMGLGKTVQMMALIVKNPPSNPRKKSTLIVVPVALLNQWQLEIEDKTTCGLTTLIYHGSNRPKRIEDLQKYDVILTSQSTLAMEWPDFEKEQKEKEKKQRKKKRDEFIVSDDEDERPTKKGLKKRQKGLLYHISWYRIVIDEGQGIRNKRTRISRAVTDLDSHYRWLLTGTPIINGLSDAYPYMRFLKIRPWYDWDEYNKHISRIEKRNPTLASNRLQAIFATTLIRRKKDSMLDGKRLIELPDKNVELVKLEFTADEREIYRMVEARSQEVFNRYLREGTVLKNYAQVLVLLLRLRQICSHPCLIQEHGDAIIEDNFEDKNISPDLARAVRVMGSNFVTNMRSKMKEVALARLAAEKESADATMEDEECPICFDHFTDVVVTACTHVFCRDCIKNVLDAPRPEDGDDTQYKATERPCPVCRDAICEEKLCSRKIFEPTDAELSGKGKPEPEPVASDSDSERKEVDEILTPEPELQRRPKGRQAKRKVRRVVESDSEIDIVDEDEDDDLSDFIVQSDEDEDEKDARAMLKKRLGKREVQKAIVIDSDEEGEHGSDDEVIIRPTKLRASAGAAALREKMKSVPKFLPSTKMKHMMESLKQWATDHPGEKTMVISQWTQCLALVSSYLQKEGIVHVKYQGDMSRPQRDLAVRAFMLKENVQVLLMSLKCGGVGLNLTRANRVISLDLGWSEAVEAQAFDRVHRLGQGRPVFVKRLVIADSVEDRVLALQDRKRNLADGSLGEGSGKKIGRLSVRELANLFGLDHRGHVLQA